MQTPICEVCLKSDMLCASCQERFGNSISEVSILRFLYKLSDKIKILRDVKILRIIDSGVIIIVANRGDAAKIVGKDGYIVKTLAKEFKKSIRVLEEAPEFKKFVQDLVSPTIVQGINTLYTQAGTVYRIVVSSAQRNRLSINPENISQILEDVYNKKTEVIFD